MFYLSNPHRLNPHGLVVFGIALINIHSPFPPALASTLPHASLAPPGFMEGSGGEHHWEDA